MEQGTPATVNDRRLYSEPRCRCLLCPDSPLSPNARNVLRAMIEGGSIGPRRAVTQATLSQATGIPPRLIQEANLELLAEGVVVCTCCSGSPGQFLAETEADVGPFRDQLTHRAQQTFTHRQLLDQAVRVAADQAASEAQGAGTLFEGATR